MNKYLHQQGLTKAGLALYKLLQKINNKIVKHELDTPNYSRAF